MAVKQTNGDDISVVLTKAQAEELRAVAKAAEMLDVDQFVMTDGIITGYHESKACAIYHECTDFPTQYKLAIRRMKDLNSRARIFDDDVKITLSVRTDPADLISDIKFTAKGCKVSFRCARPSTVEALGRLNKQEDQYFGIDEDSLKLIQRALASLKPEFVTVSIDGEEGKVIIAGTSGDSAEMTFTNTCFDGDTQPFSFCYPTKYVQQLLKPNTHEKIGINTARGILFVYINGIKCLILSYRE